MRPRHPHPYVLVAIMAAFISLLAACGGPVPVRLTTSDGYEPTERALEVLDDALTFWGVEWTLVDADDERGVLAVDLVELVDDAEVRGWSHWTGKCRKHVWSAFDPDVLTHELGHVWGLEHVDDPDNLMDAEHRDEELTDEQWSDADDSIDRFIACGGGR